MILLSAFPLLERYGRQKLGLTLKDDLSSVFYELLVRIFPELVNGDQACRVRSRAFS